MIKEINDTIDFIMKNDPASKSKLEVLLLYPGLHAVIGHKISNFLYRKDLFFSARLISQMFRFFTNIEIHPGAQINGTLFIDHGAGIVIGETAIIGNEVTIYHGVTLGGTGKDVGKRHPTVREGALVSAHAQIIGPIEIGKNAKVGAGAVVVADVPEDVTVVGVPAKVVRVHGKKDEEVIHDIEEGREYYSEKLEDLLKAASFHSSRL